MDIWDNIKKGIATVAPVLANAIVPGSGGVAAALVNTVLGCGDNPEAMATAVANMTPEQRIALLKIQDEHKEKLVELATENDKIYLLDVASARQREVEIVKATGSKDINLYVLAWIIVFGFFFMVGMLMFVTMPAANVGSVNQLFGALSAGFGVVLAYFFGSSSSSKAKTKLLGLNKRR